MGRKRSFKIAKMPPTQEQIVAAKAVVIGLPPRALDQGDFALRDVQLFDGERMTTLQTLMNHGGTAVARWKRAGLLSDSQSTAIALCEALWAHAGHMSGLVMDLSKVPGMPGGSGIAQQDALDQLSKFKQRVPDKYWSVFENVCRFDMPAGTAGSDLATNSRSAIDSARVCVCFVADLIAMWMRL